MRGFLKGVMQYIPMVFAILTKNFGYIVVGISIYALVEIGVYWESVALLVLSTVVVILSTFMVSTEHQRIKQRMYQKECGDNV